MISLSVLKPYSKIFAHDFALLSASLDINLSLMSLMETWKKISSCVYQWKISRIYLKYLLFFEEEKGKVEKEET